MIAQNAGSFIESFAPLATSGILFTFTINQKGVVYSGVTATLSGSNVTYSAGPDPAPCDFALARYFQVQGDTVYHTLYTNWQIPDWAQNSI
jgi:hypothetical protein